MQAATTISATHPAAPPSSRWRKLRRFRVLAYLLIAFALLDFVIWRYRHTWETYAPDDYAERLQGCRRQAHDVIIVGGSTVSEGIDPNVVAGVMWKGASLQRAYAFGLPGGTTTECWHAIEHGVTAPPRLLIYGICASDLNDERHEPHGPYVLMDWSDLADWWRTKPNAGEWATRQFLRARLGECWQLFRYREGIRLWTAAQLNRLWPGVCSAAATEAEKGVARAAQLRSETGFAPHPIWRTVRYDQLKGASAAPTSFMFLQKFKLGGHLQYLHRMLDWSADENVDVVLLDMPVTADLAERYYPAAHKQYREALAEVEAKRHVVVLRPTHSEVGLGEAQFADLIHLNGDGCARLSQWLRLKLTQLGKGQ